MDSLVGGEGLPLVEVASPCYTEVDEAKKLGTERGCSMSVMGLHFHISVPGGPTSLGRGRVLASSFYC